MDMNDVLPVDFPTEAELEEAHAKVWFTDLGNPQSGRKNLRTAIGLVRSCKRQGHDVSQLESWIRELYSAGDSTNDETAVAIMDRFIDVVMEYGRLKPE